MLASGVLSFVQSSFLAGSVDEFLRRVLTFADRHDRTADRSALVAVIRREEGFQPLLAALLTRPAILPAPALVEVRRVTATPGSRSATPAERPHNPDVLPQQVTFGQLIAAINGITGSGGTDYTDALTEVFARHGTRGTWYAHASVGCLHVRPFVDLTEPGGVDTMRAVAEGVPDGDGVAVGAAVA